MELIDITNGRVILKRGDGALFFIDDQGFEVKNLPKCGKRNVKTTEWADWLAMNDLINKISQGKPKIRS